MSKDDIVERYVFVFIEKTDGDPKIEYLTPKEIKEKTKNIHESDYAIFSGKVVKSFTQKHINY
jgi:hypothetical protein